MATLAQIGNAIAAEIQAASNASDWPGDPVVATRAHLVNIAEADTTFRLTVCISELASANESRDINREDMKVPLVFTKRVAAVTNALIDPLLDAVRATLEMYADPRKFDNLGDAVVKDAEVEMLYDAEALDEENLFVSLMNVTVSDYLRGPFTSAAIAGEVEYVAW